MKKTFTINISGSVFHIDEDAYQKLQNYLQMLGSHFGTSAEGREILQDIEARIAELFNERKQTEEKDVVIEAWVDEVIARMGKPEDFMEEEEEEESTEEKTVQEPAKVKRRMYRDPEHRVLGGVCSGMGAYFNIDPVILRIIFIILFFVSGGIVFFIYILLWIAVPKARTTAQRLEMRGQEATVSNIEKSIKEEVKEVKESYKRFKDSDSYSKGKDQMSQFGDVVVNVLKVILKLVVVVFGALMILLGFLGLVGFITSMVIGHSFIETAPWIHGFVPNVHMPAVANLFINPASLTILTIAISLFVGIPLLAVLFIGTKLIFRYKTNNKLIFLGSFGVWLVSLIVIIVVSAGQLNDYSKRTSINESKVINCQDCTTLYLELGEDTYQWNKGYELDLDRMKVITDDGETILLGEPRLDVEKSSSNEFVVMIRKKARGSSQEAAKENVEEISYTFTQKDSTIYFDPYYKLEDGSRWLDQEVDITLKVPEGKSIYLGDKLVKIIYDIENVSNTWDGDMVGKYWKMTDLGLEEVEK
ncbi:PspC domain-containing protein [Sunxiuqinia sp. A32]|uniref:PspC domain-containing protein n=1 Tax=Sunxiuqinia sp. A32 TaxID=3461496 RepID=UPI0040461156